jgi:hypothetical protein
MEGNHCPNIFFKSEDFYHTGMLWILDNLQLKKDMLEPEHDLKVVNYMGHSMTIEQVRLNAFWPEMGKYIEDYVCICLESQTHQAA